MRGIALLMLQIGLLAMFLIGPLPWPGLCYALPAKVIKVSDGDTLTVLTEDKRQVRVRLFGIDCPEKKQAYGSRATEFTREMAALQDVDVQELDVDRYGRIIGRITLEDGRVLNAEIVAHGWAWVYRAYCKMAECTAWLQLEARARQQRIGLWQGKDPVPPWEWRKARREERRKKK
ncbi:thermonuclease family protein [Desulfocurvibacter africanus]|uniref:thermonuclease family protein n=1 Tax=Desulfocurvibacter africanus TaxID=873 RepID=UPI000412EBAD|nr:thermonuclease family protein [Desulfocurvibacter africanus]